MRKIYILYCFDCNKEYEIVTSQFTRSLECPECDKKEAIIRKVEKVMEK
jgi:Zn finger protein HypA/HybF involved in hydrogenase expression